MSVPPVDKIDEVSNNNWEVLFQDFPNPEILYILGILAMDEHAIMTKVKARSRVCKRDRSRLYHVGLEVV